MRSFSPVLRCDLPVGSIIHTTLQTTLPGADFADCYQFADLWPDKNALETFIALMQRSPWWMNGLMNLRNQAVRLVGLKHLGSMTDTHNQRAASDYQPGQRVGIFTLQQAQPYEVIVFDDDKHLKVQLSLLKHRVQGQAVVSLSTVVHSHNRLGRAYMAVVGPVHSVIVPRMLAQVTRHA